MSARIAAIVLAAGASRRLGQPKQLLIHQGEPLLGRAIRLAHEAGADPVLTILGANADGISAAVGLGNSIHILNENWPQGIASSIRAGICALDSVAFDGQGVLILPCDQPRLTAHHLRTLIESFHAQAQPSIAASNYADVLGIPAVFPRQMFSDLLALDGDKGARTLLAKPPCPLIAVPFPGGEVDIDEPGDLAQLR